MLDEELNETAVKAKHFPKRSSSFEPDGNGGLRLRHIGFLGGTPPAVSTLRDLDFSESENAITFEFSMPGFEDKTRWSFNGIARAFRSLRDWMISSQDLETADRVLPEYMVADLQAQADAMREERNFSKPPVTTTKPTDKKPEKPMSEFSQQDLDNAVSDERAKREAAEQRIQTMEYEAKVAKAETLIEDLVKKGCLLPAQREGFAEFMAQQPDDKENTFEFSAADKTKVKKTPYEFITEFASQLKPQIKTGADDREDADEVHSNFSAPRGAVVNGDREKLRQRALEYSRKNNVSFAQAASILEQEQE